MPPILKHIYLTLLHKGSYNYRECEDLIVASSRFKAPTMRGNWATVVGILYIYLKCLLPAGTMETCRKLSCGEWRIRATVFQSGFDREE